jgi:hypothetical protein
MDVADIEHIDRAQACFQRARARLGEVDTSKLACELIYHLDMMLRVITSIRIMSGELDDAQLVLTPRARASASRRSGIADVHEDDGQRTVTTVESAMASHEWSIPGPHTT